MNSDLLIRIGRAMYGERWQREMARALNVNERTVHHWIVGRYRMREEHAAKLAALVDDRARTLTGIQAELLGLLF